MTRNFDRCYGPDGEPLTLDEWSAMFAERHKTIDVPESWWRKLTYIDYDPGRPLLNREAEVHVSTVWVGIDQRFGGHGPPLVWEAMIFGGDHDGDQYRYSSRAEAFDHHEQLVRELRAEAAARVENGG